MSDEPLADVLRNVAARVEETIAGEERLRALFDAVTAVSGDLELQPTLTRLVEAAARLVGARYAALGVLDASGEGLAEFVTVGIDADTITEIGPLPHGLGILGLLIKDPRPLRLHDLKSHPASYGFPDHHPPMRSFLGVPVRVGEHIYGNLYLTEKAGGADFTAEDEQAIIALAGAAAVAVDNARLYQRSEQQARRLGATAEIQQAVLAQRPIGDVLQLLVDRAREVTLGDTALMVLQGAGGDLAVQAASGADAERLQGTALPLEGALADVVEHGATVHLAQGLSVAGLEEGGSALLVPFGGPDGAGGAIIVTRLDTERGAPSDEDIAALRGFASQTSIALSLARAQADLAALAVVQDRERIARDLHDVVIQRLFAVGITLQGIRSQPSRADASELLGSAAKDLDRTIEDIRSSIFQLERDPADSGLRGLVHDTLESAGTVRPELTIKGPIDIAVPPNVGKEMLAVLAEALSNASRHADATAVAVTITVEGDMLSLVVADDGVGFAPGGRASGLRNMLERAEGLGGSFDVDSVPGQGTTITWRVPLT